MGMYRSNKNYGWGKNIKFAAKNSLRDMYGHGHFATVAAHQERWNQFVKFLATMDIKDASLCTLNHIEIYAKHLIYRVENGEMAVAYAQNLLSTVNVILDAMGADKSLRISPAKFVGKRSAIRQEAPVMSTEIVLDSQQEMIGQNLIRIRSIVDLIRTFGLRSKEASLLDSKQAFKEAKSKGCVTIIKGTKGGRKRDVPIRNQDQIIALEKAATIQGNGNNLILPGLTWIQWKNGLLREGRETLKSNGVPGFHDQRAAYACLRYEEITGNPAPVLGCPIEDYDLDKRAREIIAEELGHNRIDVTTEYLGARR